MMPRRPSRGVSGSCGSRTSRLLSLLLAAALLPASFSPLGAEAQVVGLDLGSEFVKVALVAAGRPIEILLNTSSKRKTSNAVSFADAEKRELGDEGAAQASKKPDQVFLHSNLLLGLNATDYGLADVTTTTEDASRFVPLHLKGDVLPSGFPHAYYPYRLYMDRQRHSLAVLARDGLYLPAELVTANMLAFVKTLATQAAGVSADTSIGCVISIPCRYTQRQRQALRDAVEIAGMNPIAFNHHSVTAAVQHGLDLPTNTTATKLFYDVGSSGVDVGVVEFSPVVLPSKKEVLQVRLLACESVKGAGGHHLDLAIAEKMREAFEKRHPSQTLENVPRALKKLVKQAVMSKHVLSANKQTHFRVEGLHNDVDFHEPMERAHVEQMLQERGMLEKLKSSLDATLAQAGMSMENIDQVELLGGGWRVPRVQQEVSALVGGKEVGTHLNGDEAMATGSAFIAANSTVTFRVKQMLLSDISPFEYMLKIAAVAEEDDEETGVKKGEKVEKNKVLIARNTRLAQGSRTVSLRTAHDFAVEIMEDEKVLMKLEVMGVADAAKKLEEEAEKLRAEKQKDLVAAGLAGEEEEPPSLLPKANMVFRVDGTGVLAFDRAFLTQDYHIFVPVTTTTTRSTTTKSSASEAETTTTTTAAPPQPKVKRVTKQVTDALKWRETLQLPLPLTAEEKKELRKQLQAFEAADLRVQRLAEAMDRLESSIYAARGLLEEEAIARVSLPEVRENLRKTLEEDEEWIYDSAKAEGIDAVKKRLTALQDIVEPMKKRAEELEARPKAVEKMQQALSDAKSRLEQIETRRKWVPQEKIQQALAFRDEVAAWWKEKLDAQQAKADTEDPVFTKAEVLAKVKEVGAAIKALENIPRPTTTTTTAKPQEGEKAEEKKEGEAGEEKKEGEAGDEKKEGEAGDEKKEGEAGDEKKEGEAGDEKKEGEAGGEAGDEKKEGEAGEEKKEGEAGEEKEEREEEKSSESQHSREEL
ncbi:DnaK family protein [Besnoitia besnoiti]|uniref:DnaK family protein n=1 Tax=Besnoitia besnoiti TaxID=94643 RepID=A0A2A9MB31_BESBE|nr:DnaK family protein [Besnoitia besnoiti]PFH35089.1 DnaK family protein [Besnoitia besnoiti]